MWTYYQTSGKLYHDGNFVITGYSGHEEGINNPKMENVHDVGPIPRGQWTIGPAYKHPKLGPICMDLFPRPTTETFGRTEFRIHADSIADFGKQQASHGCLILSRPFREMIRDSPDKDLEVIL